MRHARFHKLRYPLHVGSKANDLAWYPTYVENPPLASGKPKSHLILGDNSCGPGTLQLRRSTAQLSQECCFISGASSMAPDNMKIQSGNYKEHFL